MNVIIDSGAYTIWNKARKGDKAAAAIGIPQYCDWLTANKGMYTHYVNFDVIDDGQASYDNWIEMRRRGFNPLPVYHASTDVKFLKRYLDAGADYICMGAVAFLGMRYRYANFDNVWSNYLTDSKGFPIVKVHGFGLTSQSIMVRYPWYSVDSSSWAFIARHGGLFIARKNDKGVFDFTLEHFKWNVSTRAPHKKSIPHLRTKGRESDKMLREYLDYIETPYGKSSFRLWNGEDLAPNESLWKRKEGRTIIPTVEIVHEKGVINDQQMRNEANIKFFILTAEALPKYPWAFKRAQHFRKVVV